jgi:hypothetical protein
MRMDEWVRRQYESEAQECRHLAERLGVFIESEALAADFERRAEELETLLLELPGRPPTAA